MGKKQNEEDGPNLSSVPNKDLMHRMSFLYQMAAHFSTLEASGSKPEASDQGYKATSRKHHKRKGTLNDLAAFHVRTMKTIGNKSMVKIDPSVKRTICSVCFNVMTPGHSTTRVHGSAAHRFIVRHECSRCGESKTIPRPPHSPAERQSNASAEGETPSKGGRRRASRAESRASRPPTVFERGDHIVHVSRLSYTETAANHGSEISNG